MGHTYEYGSLTMNYFPKMRAAATVAAINITVNQKPCALCFDRYTWLALELLEIEVVFIENFFKLLGFV